MGYLSGIIKDGLVQLEAENYRARLARSNTSKTLTASTAYGCSRANWYNVKKQRRSNYEADVNLLMRFREGNDAHEAVGPLLTDVGVKVLDKEFGVKGKGVYARVDYKIKIEDKVYNVEVKTMEQGSFQTFCENGVSAFHHYNAQCQVILAAEPHIPLIFLAKCVFPIDWEDELVQKDPEIINQIGSKELEFEDAVLKEEPPERPFEYGSTQCKGCDYRYRCWMMYIRANTLEEKDLDEKEKKAVDYLYQEARRHFPSSVAFDQALQSLKSYIAYLHSKHSSDVVKLEGIRSRVIHTKGIARPDLVELQKLISEADFGRIMIRTPSNYIKTTPYFDIPVAEDEEDDK